eukprot:TRINITY_DN925_c0_g1_i3.p1 TRINITY_DN925_c0_g1~~TRINITY_DN925_c0_g1_i3.p1  ORF type:complete len:480 (+),score=117.28 TRINITY_DN925_c0_g1_i3:92-1531(+)
MSFHNAKFAPTYKLFSSGKPETQGDQTCAQILEQNHLVKKEIARGPNSLVRALSDALYLTTVHADELQTVLIDKLKGLIQSNKLPLRLQYLRNNFSIFKDYASNPGLPGFDKITLEVFSIVFRKKVIVYSISEDYYLSALIINHGWTETVQLLKTAGNYETVYDIQRMSSLTMAQNVVLNIVDRALNGDSNDALKDINREEYINLEKPTKREPVKSSEAPSNGIPQSKHKKSKSFDHMSFVNEEQFGHPRSVQSEMEIKRQLAFLDEETWRPQNQLPIFKGLLRIGMNTNSQEDQGPTNPMEAGQVVSFMNQPPPGLTPPRFLQRQFSERQAAQGGFSPQGVSAPTNNAFDFSDLHFLLNQGMPRDGKNGFLGANGMPLMGDKAAMEKRRPIILDEGKERYTGRLKFFDEAKNYGFIIMDGDGSDIFVHFDDLSKANINRELLRSAKAGNMIRMSFGCMNYIGKYNRSRKAVDIQVLYD